MSGREFKIEDIVEENNLETTLSCRVFPKEFAQLRAIVRLDPDVFNLSHAVRIGIHQFINSRLLHLHDQGVISEEEFSRIERGGSS